jgi:hypothetical protein
MIYFFADDHYGVNPGKVLVEHLPEEWKNRISFQENDWTLLESGTWLGDCELLILNLIGTTCNLPHPGEGAERSVREWYEKGGNILLLHGASAAFWQWDWWRKIPGYRWVRPGDPDGVKPSTHPVKPYRVVPCKTRHPLISVLKEMDFPEDEIYTDLENTNPVFHLMETAIPEGTFVQCCETVSPSGGKIVSFLPGHSPAVTDDPVFVQNITALIQYLL